MGLGGTEVKPVCLQEEGELGSPSAPQEPALQGLGRKCFPAVEAPTPPPPPPVGGVAWPPEQTRTPPHGSVGPM